jgi:hypothetical protein
LTDKELHNDWFLLKRKLGQLTGKEPKDLNAVLFLIGVQELGRGPQHFSKEEKQDLMHIATCAVLSLSNFYMFSHRDDEGWPHYKQVGHVSKLKLKDQTMLLKEHIIKYAYTNEILEK